MTTEKPSGGYIVPFFLDPTIILDVPDTNWQLLRARKWGALWYRLRYRTRFRIQRYRDAHRKPEPTDSGGCTHCEDYDCDW